MAFSGWTTETWDRVVASDPGLHRLRMALSAGAAMATALGVEYGYAKLTHADAKGLLTAMLLGTVMAMLGSMALAGPRVWPKVRTAVFFPVAIGAGMLPGVAVAGHADLTLVMLVVVMFVAVYIRRFGQPYFFHGFMLWMGYFFAAFLHAQWSDLGSLMIDATIGIAWVLLLSVTVLRTHPRRTLRRVLRAFDARARAVARVSADLLRTGPDEERRRARLRRRLHSRQLRLAETALIVEGWSAEPDALPHGWSAPMLRRRLLEAHLAVDEFAAAAGALIVDGVGTDAGAGAGAGANGDVAEAARIAEHLARREDQAAGRRARTLLAPKRSANGSAMPGSQHAQAQQLARTALEFIDLATRWDTPPEVSDSEAFAPAVVLAMGALPGSGAVAGGVPARSAWHPFSRIPLTTRQAVQVAVAGTLAIIAGRELSQARYYWAVIATFIAFTGTATRSEVSIKAGNRVLGTLLGFGVGLGLVHLTVGHTLWTLAAIVVSMSCGFYLVSISYAGMIFFVTIMVSQLYSALHEYSAGLIVLRLEETAIGAGIGIAVALLVLPTSTRDTVETATRQYFAALADAARAIAGQLTAQPVARRGNERVPNAPDVPNTPDVPDARDLDALTRALDVRLQQLALVARPLTHTLGRPFILRNDAGLARHRITLYAALTRQIRQSAHSVRRPPSENPDTAETAALSRSYGAIADLATAIAESPPHSKHLALGTARSTAIAAAAAAAEAVRREPAPTPLPRLWHLLDELDVVPPAPARLSPADADANADTNPVAVAVTDARATQHS